MNLLIIVFWLTFSFLLWRNLRRYAVEEDRIFDLTFYATLVAFVAARAGFVVTHPEQFLGKSPLLFAAMWVTPGLSWLSGFIGGVATLVALSRRYKVRLGLVLDALAVALPLPIVSGQLVRAQWYDAAVMAVVSIVIFRLSIISAGKKWPYGIVGTWFFLLYAASSFVLEFFAGSRVYWRGLTANQWMLIGIFAESVGVLYVRGGGRERLRLLWRKLYELVSQRYARRNQKTS